MATSLQPQSTRRLDSWKEIAAFFERDERTVRRWEVERGLPIHRVPGTSRGSVFAFASELEAWLRRPQPEPAGQSEPIPTPSPIPIAAQAQGDRSSTRVLPWVIAALLSFSVFAAVYSYRQTTHFHARAAGSSSTGRVPSPEAQDLYLKGRFAWNQRTPESLNQAVDLFTQAIVHDPNYADAYIGLADCYNLLREFSVMPPTEAYPRALAAARKAVELDPTSSAAHTSLAFALFWGNVDAAAGEREFKRALVLDPNNSRAHHWYATFLVQIRRYPEALAEIERARRLDPHSAAIMADKGLILFKSGKTRESVALLKQLEAADPSFSETHRYLAFADFSMGDYPSYFAEQEAGDRLVHDQDGEFVLQEQRKGFGTGGVRGLEEGTLHAHQKLYDKGRATDFILAADYAMLNQKAEALRHLELAYEKRDPGMTSMLDYNEFNNIREEPAFRQIATQVGLPQAP